MKLIIVYLLIIILSMMITYYKPVAGFVIAVSVNLIKGIILNKFSFVSMRGQAPQNIWTGVILPLAVFSVIVLKLFLREKKIKFRFDFTDMVIFFGMLVFTVGVLYSVNINSGSIKLFKIFFLMTLYYYVTKLYFSNIEKEELKIEIELFIKVMILLSVVYAISPFLLMQYGEKVRLTIRGVHPIIYSQTIGASVLACIYILFKDLQKFSVRGTAFLSFITLGLFFVFFQSKTRGTLLSLIIAIIYLYLLMPALKNKLKITKIFAILVLFFLPVILLNYDISSFFTRYDALFSGELDKSINIRFELYMEAFTIYMNHPILGIGTGSLASEAIFAYPHNMLLELMAENGIPGIIFFSGLCFSMFIIFLYIIKVDKVPNEIHFIFALCIYYFIETNFSFSIWMNKGFFMTLAVLSGIFRIQKGGYDVIKE